MSFDIRKLKFLENDQFSIDLPKFYVLDPNDGNKFLLQGYGWIKKQGDNFAFKIFPSEVSGKGNIIVAMEKFSTDKDGYSSLIGIDEYGAKWCFKTTGFGFSLPGSAEGRISINGTFNILESKSEFKNESDKQFINMYFYDKYKFPYNKVEKLEVKKDVELVTQMWENVVDCQFKNLTIRSSKFDNFIILSFEKKIFENNFEYRILEGLQFITGRQLQPILITKYIEGNYVNKIFSKSNEKIDYHIEPPLQFYYPPSKENDNSWNLFYNFLEFISDFKGKFYSPLGSEINGLIGAGASFFETKLLVLGVRIEGLLNLLFPNLALPNDSSLKALTDLEQQVSNMQLIDSIKERVVSSIASMKFPRAKDKLLELKKIGVINKIQYDSWSKMRNKSAHAVREDDDLWFEKSMNCYYNVLEMMYRLIFHAIGYNGLYTSYSDKKFLKIPFDLYK